MTLTTGPAKQRLCRCFSSIKLILLTAACTFFLVGCHAMDTWDHIGKRYKNDKQNFYIPEKRANVGALSHAYRWKQGNLEGFCRQEKKRQQHIRDDDQLSRGSVAQAVLVDEVLLSDDVAVLFETDSARLTPVAEAVLYEFGERISLYDQVLGIELEGHTDNRASEEYNQLLSARRNSSVKNYLQQLGVAPNITETPFGESLPLSTDNSVSALQQNRRVVARIRALDVSADNTNPSLCYPLPDYAGTTRNLPYSLSKSAVVKAEGQVVPPAGLPVSGGDQVNLAVSADDAFAGIYEVNMAGELVLPILGAVRIGGLTVPQIRETLSTQLVQKEIVQPYASNVDVAIQQYSPVEVFVRGAVFYEGRVTINAKKAEISALNANTRSGDFSSGRFLSQALIRAGGVRPDANISNVILARGNSRTTHNFSGLFSGKKVTDVALISGDEIIVPTTGKFQGALAKPSPITPFDMRVYLSNPTVPILNNTSAAVDSGGAKLPYGARFLRALVSANCVGGVQSTNAARRGVLISTNPLTGSTEVIERSIQQLISDPDRDDINPHVMPDDGVACYDSSVTNIRDVARTFSEVFAPIMDFRELFKVP